MDQPLKIDPGASCELRQVRSRLWKWKISYHPVGRSPGEGCDPNDLTGSYPDPATVALGRLLVTGITMVVGTAIGWLGWGAPALGAVAGFLGCGAVFGASDFMGWEAWPASRKGGQGTCGERGAGIQPAPRNKDSRW